MHTLAALGISERERALTLTLLARALHDRESRLTATPSAVPQLIQVTTTPSVGADVAAETIDIPVPLDEAAWRELLDRQVEPSRQRLALCGQRAC